MRKLVSLLVIVLALTTFGFAKARPPAIFG